MPQRYTKGFGHEQKGVGVFCDSQSTIDLSKNNVHHERTKHVDIKFHKIRQVIADGHMHVLMISTLSNTTYILTKILPISKFQTILNLLRVKTE